MSQARPRNELKTPADAIAALGRGTFHPSDLIPLSDLGRADAAAFRQVWPTLPEQTRITCVRYMAELAEDDVRYTFGRALRVALDDDSPIVRQLAISALWEDDGSDMIDRLLDMLANDPSQDVRAEAAQGLGKFAERAAGEELDHDVASRLYQALVQVAQDDDQPLLVRRRALESVAVFGSDAVIVRLIMAAYDDDDTALKAGALYAMGRSLDLRWLPTVMNEFGSPDAELRYEAARASGQLGDDRAVPGLAYLAREEDVEVRHAAIDALGKIGGTSSVNVLRRLARSAPAVDTEAIEEALEEALISLDALRLPT